MEPKFILNNYLFKPIWNIMNAFLGQWILKVWNFNFSYAFFYISTIIKGKAKVVTKE